MLKRLGSSTVPPSFQHPKLKRIIIGVSARFCLIPAEEDRLTPVTQQHRPQY